MNLQQVCRFTDSIKVTTTRTIRITMDVFTERMFLQLLAEIGGIRHEHACGGTGVVQANDLHDNK